MKDSNRFNRVSIQLQRENLAAMAAQRLHAVLVQNIDFYSWASSKASIRRRSQDHYFKYNLSSLSRLLHRRAPTFFYDDCFRTAAFFANAQLSGTYSSCTRASHLCTRRYSTAFFFALEPDRKPSRPPPVCHPVSTHE
jgi:hypothetical protein